MSIQYWIGKPYENTGENEQVAMVVRALDATFKDVNETIHVFFNPRIPAYNKTKNGFDHVSTLDLLVLKRGNAVIVELKNYKGAIEIAPDGKWYCRREGRLINIKGGYEGRTPLGQVTEYRDQLATYLKLNASEFMKGTRKAPFDYKKFVSSVIVFPDYPEHPEAPLPHDTFITKVVRLKDAMRAILAFQGGRDSILTEEEKSSLANLKKLKLSPAIIIEGFPMIAKKEIEPPTRVKEVIKIVHVPVPKEIIKTVEKKVYIEVPKEVIKTEKVYIEKGAPSIPITHERDTVVAGTAQNEPKYFNTSSLIEKSPTDHESLEAFKTFFENLAHLQGSGHPSLQDIIGAAANTMSPYERSTAYKRTGHGVRIYETEEELNAYLVAYGEMHLAKLNALLNKIDPSVFAKFSRGVTIVDWGCGQGLATLAFLDWVERHPTIRVPIKAIRLLEISDAARERAFKVISRRLGTGATNVVKQLPWRHNSTLSLSYFDIPEGVPVLHLFSNILDVAEVNLSEVATVVEEMKQQGPSLVLSVSPNNRTSSRVETFWQLLGRPFVLRRLNTSIPLENARYIQSLKSCSIIGLSYELDGPPNPSQVKRTVITHTFELGGAIDATLGLYPSGWGKYSYTIPAEIGAISPKDTLKASIYAVLNNLFARGNPSRASIATETRLSKDLSLTQASDAANGAICFDFIDVEQMQRACNSVKEKIDPFKERPSFTSEEMKYERLLLEPLLVTRIQHAISRALLDGQLDAVKGLSIKTLAVERDIRCTKAALEELSESIEHLVDFAETEFRVPKIHFEVTSCNLDTIEQYVSECYDLVIDVSFYRRTPPSVALDDIKRKAAYSISIVTASPQAIAEGFSIVTGENIVYSPIVQKLQDGTYGALSMSQHLRYFLQNIFRKVDFRPGQLPILDRALRDKSVIGLLPTGGGKSLTYQLAGMMQPGIVMVVDPLRSLMKDQYDGLVHNGITAASFINSMQNSQEQTDAMRRVMSGNSKFIFVSPERLSMPGFRRELLAMFDNGIYYSYGVIDEVHCVSEWGHDFRFNYLHLGRNLHQFIRRKPSNRFKNENDSVVPLFGLTATASFDVLSDVERELTGPGGYELDPDATIRYENTNRLELQYHIVRVEPDEEYGQDLAADVNRYEREIRKWQDEIAKSPKNSRLKLFETQAIANLGRARNKLKKFYTRGKEEVLPSIIKEQERCFEELQRTESVERIKSRFLERESIDPGSNLGKSVLNADLDTRLNIQEWLQKDATYSSAGLIFCPYKGFKETSRTYGPPALSVESIRNQLIQLYSKEAVRHFTGSTSMANHDKVIMQNQDDYIANKAAVMVATTAFGMGIDKPNIRFVIEMSHPKSLEAFVQEAGRAGRDKKMALATILFSGQRRVDFDVVNYFHKENFIGIKEERSRLVKLFQSTEMRIENGEEGDGTLIKGFYTRLMAAPLGGTITVIVPYQQDTKDGKTKDEQPIYDKLIYRLCCIGLVQDVECLYPPGGTPRELKLTMVHREEGAYYEALRHFLMRYFSEARATAEVEKVRAIADKDKRYTEIGSCILYLEEFVYKNIQRKRLLAMEDMNTFCEEGVRGVQGGKSWLEVNEDLKDFVYYYFNSKYARSGYRTQSDEPYSLIDDTDSGREFSFETIEKYLRVVEESLQDGGSPKDNAKHLLGAVRLIARGAIETNPALSILHAFCLCYLGFHGNRELLSEVIRRIGESGFALILRRNLVSKAEAWSRFRWLQEEFAKKTDLSSSLIDRIFTAARAGIHTASIRELINQ